jgi:diaminohydroxyphosphoribosylaminopyrimidine deaminase/5-amino-6-(5-phosphoribosylamino)uracil reductase
VVTRSGDLPARAHLFTDAQCERTLVFRGKSLRAVLRDLGKRGVTSVMIEGGGAILGEAFDRGLVDRVQFYVAPVLCGGPAVIGGRGVGATMEAPRLRNVAYEKVGRDLRLTGEVALSE